MIDEWNEAAKEIATTLSEFIGWLGEIPEEECQQMAPIIKRNVAEWRLLRDRHPDTKEKLS